MEVTVQTDGFDELDRIIKKLPIKMQQRVLRTGVAAGARVIVKEARKLVPRDSGDLRKGIRVRTFKPNIDGAEAIATSTKWYSHFIEFGTERHAVGKGSDLDKGKQYGLVIGGVRPRRFMSTAFNNTRSEQLKAMGKALMKGIEREVNK